MNRTQPIVLKFGSSVLASRAHLWPVVQEIYRFVRIGRPVVAVVSAFAGTTDRLWNTFEASHGREPTDPDQAHAVAAWLGTGEREAVDALTHALTQNGVPNTALNEKNLGLTSKGHPLDAHPTHLDLTQLRAALLRFPAVVVPGFVAVDEFRRPTILGRGGSDLTALWIALHLGAQCRLVKDVDGWFEQDPRESTGNLRRYRCLSFTDAIRRPSPIVQDKTVRCAQQIGHPFEVGGLGSSRPTQVGTTASELEDHRPTVPLRVAVLGCGTVGEEVVRRLLADPRFQVTGVLVRNPLRRRDGVPADLLFTDGDAWDRVPRDVVVDLLPGTADAWPQIAHALRHGQHVVSANKAWVARRHQDLVDAARASGARVLTGATVGGGVPMLERVRQLRQTGGAASEIVSLRGVLNATSTVVLEGLQRGETWETAVANAQRLGFAEAEPWADLSGEDAAAKLILLSWEAFGRAPLLSVTGVPKRLPITTHRVRLVAHAWRTADGVRGTVCPEVLPPEDALHGTDGGTCTLVVHQSDQSVIHLTGMGAGAGPTAVSVMGDLVELWESPRAQSDRQMSGATGARVVSSA